MSVRARTLNPAACLPVGAALILAGTSAHACQCDVGARRVAESKTKPPAEAARSFACPAGLLAARRGGSDPNRYVPPDADERAAITEFVATLVTGGSSARPGAAAAAAAFGYDLEDVPELPGVVLLRESPKRRRGGGAYLFRLEEPAPVAVQANHTFFDEGTLPLACELFGRARSIALFIDTAHRYKAANPDEEGNSPADVAHARESLFQAATAGLLRARPNLTVVQLHGFGPRESGPAVVLSNGVARRGGTLGQRVQQQLSAVVKGRVDRFPDETSELGATTNVQGELVRAAGGAFLHVEMAAALRRTLLADAALRARFLQALARSLMAP